MERLDAVLNFRDVGKTVNEFVGSKLLKEGLLFRSARPDAASENDQKRIRTDLKITNVIDLRSKSEHLKEAQKRDIAFPKAVPAAPPNAVAALPLQIQGLRYHYINLNGRSFERSLMRQLSWSSFSKLLGLMLFGYRMEAISIMGREVIQPQGLVGLGRSSIDSCGDEIRQAFEIISNAANYGLLVHCTQGKDRTGLIIALILFLLDVPLKAVTHDYVLSEAELLPEKKERMKEINEIGLTEDFAGTPSDWAEKMLSHIREEYNTVSEYLTRIGIDSNMQATVRSNLIFE